jgi:hypothetical protein
MLSRRWELPIGEDRAAKQKGSRTGHSLAHDKRTKFHAAGLIKNERERQMGDEIRSKGAKEGEERRGS